MARADEGRPGAPTDADPIRTRPAWATGIICLAFLPLAGFIGRGGQTLWREFASLRGEQAVARTGALIGYININPNPSYARCPQEWIVADGERAKLWAGWDGRNHRWFHYDPQGAIDARKLSIPIGRDVIQAVDRPIHEENDGAFWARIPDEAPVAVVAMGGRAALYPIKVLDKVAAVNDRLGSRPFLIVYTPYEGYVTTYERAVSGRELVLGHSGYFHGHEPVLYDRETESLWVARDEDLTAVAGRRRGEKLPRIGRAPTLAWATCRVENPRGRLMVGAERNYATAAK